ncbi:MAG: hypothetical protein KC506_03745 [Nanoarchaeota archaeon]|nr:hypothetical protein [Nanoarchaeota archaeon]
MAAKKAIIYVGRSDNVYPDFGFHNHDWAHVNLVVQGRLVHGNDEVLSDERWRDFLARQGKLIGRFMTLEGATDYKIVNDSDYGHTNEGYKRFEAGHLQPEYIHALESGIGLTLGDLKSATKIYPRYQEVMESYLKLPLAGETFYPPLL